MEFRMPFRALALALVALLLVASPAYAADRLAFFGFDLINTSPEPTHPDESARLATIADIARADLAKHGYEIVDTAPVADEIANLRPLRDCNGCELDLAKELGADLAALGWVQKVSNLILNINLQIRDVRTGQLVHAASADIRGNTNESWEHGIRYLIKNRLFAPESSSGNG
jgi:hypothetical protein